MVRVINKLQISTKYTLCKGKCKFDGRNCNSNQRQNNDECLCECKYLKEHYVCEKNYIWNLATCSCKNGKYLASITDDLIITCDEIEDTVTKSYNEATRSTSTEIVLKQKCCNQFIIIIIIYYNYLLIQLLYFL